jgi:hypothetical protein
VVILFVADPAAAIARIRELRLFPDTDVFSEEAFA